MISHCLRFCACLLIGLLIPCWATAEPVRVAVAANFTAPAKQLADAFEKQSGESVKLSFGSTGKLYAQILHGAPFEVYLAADRQRPRQAIDAGLAVAGSAFSYAQGQLVLWSADPGLFDDGEQYLKQQNYNRLAIAHPKTAPYGRAARQLLERFKLWPALQPKLVRGESINQAFQFTATGNAQIGLVALSQISGWNKPGSQWPVPAHYHAPIDQQAVLLKRGQHNPAAQAFIEFLRSPQAGHIIKQYGYNVPTLSDH